ncbi:RNA-binding lark-like [Brachionus plicatilis]|uniref:RNA-binding lark-like n=1 Tax=Brachionus plicatilis TaxID=10195 RepID=A0A3M7PMP4_BRAPC|nr:RNA-binding lark-like [Brachionus plicatilis]
MSVKIYVGNIPSVARNAELKELFEKFGKVAECDILKDYGFVHMEDTSDAKAAIAGLNDSLWKGSRIRVEISTTRTQKGEPSIRRRYRPPPTSRFSDRRTPPPFSRDYSPPYRGREPRGPPFRDARYPEPYSRSYERPRPYPDSRSRPLSPPPRDFRLPPFYRDDPYSRRPYPRPPSPPPPPRGFFRSRSRSPRERPRHEKRRYRSRSSSPRSGH